MLLLVRSHYEIRNNEIREKLRQIYFFKNNCDSEKLNMKHFYNVSDHYE
jgi:hypothetical protein